MKTLIRILVSLLVVLWLGGVMFFPAVAAISFRVLPDPHTAGLIVRNCLITLHQEGMVAGLLLLALLAAAGATRAYGRSVIAPIACVLVMLGLTAFSQLHVIPQMEADRQAVGGDMDAVPKNDPHHVHFDKLHSASEELEEAVLVVGIVLIVLLARPARTA